MEDLGAPQSYMSLEEGTPVLASDGEPLGEVEHVLADPDADIFDGIVIDTSILPGGHRFADSEQVGEIHERGVLLKLDRAAAEALPEPGPNPASISAGADDLAPDDLGDKLRRAWDMISGKY